MARLETTRSCERCGVVFRHRQGPRQRFCSLQCSQSRSRPAAVRATVAERFWSKVDRHGPIPSSRPELGPCWIWTASTNYGYGKFHFDTASRPKRSMPAHRWSYETLVGAIPIGLDLDHLCRVPRCVNPSHLEPVTRRENLRRGNHVLPPPNNQTHCIHGHLLGGDNVYPRPNHPSWRSCATCRRLRHAVSLWLRRRADDEIPPEPRHLRRIGP